MKKSNIAFLFQKHEAKKVATQTAPPIPDADEELSIPIVEDPLIVSVESGIVALAVDEGTETPTVVATGTTDEVEEEEEEEPPLAAADDVDSLEHDPGLRSSISTFDVNEQDSIRRRTTLVSNPGSATAGGMPAGSGVPVAGDGVGVSGVRVRHRPQARLKYNAGIHPKFRGLIIGLAQANHRFTTNMQRRVYGRATDIHIRPLNEEIAIQAATDLLGELFVFSDAQEPICAMV